MKSKIRSSIFACLALVMLFAFTTAFAASEPTPTSKPADPTVNTSTNSDRDTVYDDISWESAPALSAKPAAPATVNTSTNSDRDTVYDDISWESAPAPSAKPAAPADADVRFDALDPATTYDTMIEGSRRDGSVPTETTTLPYEASGIIYEYSYTNYKFKPSSSGEIDSTFNGTISSGTATVTISLYDCNLGRVVVDYPLGTGSSWGNNGIGWYQLDTTHYYCVRVAKSTPSNSLTFTLNNTY